MTTWGRIGLAAFALAACRPSSPPSGADEGGATAHASAATSASLSDVRDVRAATADVADASTPPSSRAERLLRDATITTLDESSDGKTVELARGQKLVVLLAASPTSGFDWAVVKGPTALGEPILGYVPPTGDAMGASGMRRLTWKVGGVLPDGEQSVELAYRRSFEPGVAPQKVFRFKVRPAR